MRRIHAALVVVAVLGSLFAPRRAVAHGPPSGAEQLALYALGACRATLGAYTRNPIRCEADATGAHGTCVDGRSGTYVVVDFCDASGAFAAPDEAAYVCGVRWADCPWCLPSHELVLPWRAGTWPPDAMERLRFTRACGTR